MNLRYLVYELKEEIKGLWLVVLAGAIGPSVVCVLAYLLKEFLLLPSSPLPIALAAFIKRKEKGIGSAVLLGSSLGYMIAVLTALFWVDPVCFIGLPMDLPSGILNTVIFPFAISLPTICPIGFSSRVLCPYSEVLFPIALLLPMLWLSFVAYPAHAIAGKKVSSRLVLLTISASLAIGSILSFISSMKDLEHLKNSLIFSSLLDVFLSSYLVLCALGRMKGKGFMISLLTFSLLVRSMFW